MNEDFKILENGVYREMTDEEKLQLLIEGQKEKLEELEHGKSLPNALEMLDIICNSVKINVDGHEVSNEEKENDSYKTPNKLGYKLVQNYDATKNTIYFTFEKDENALGLANNPIYYYDGVKLIDNAYYIKDGKRVVYMGGEFIEF